MEIMRGTREQIGCIPEVNFGHVAYREAETAACQVISLHQVKPADIKKYLLALTPMGYACEERRDLGSSQFYAFRKEETDLFLHYFPDAGHLNIVGEKQSGYFKREKPGAAGQMQPLLTHIDLEDYGMSYLIRLSDGRFLVIDGGWEFEPDADKLMQQLRIQSPFQKPVIAAWIFTHPHIDHYRCFLVFHEKYREQVQIQAFLYNFPQMTEDLVSRVPRLLEEEETEYLQRLETYVARTGAPVMRPHTGQTYYFGDVCMEVLASTDDACYGDCSLNSVSLVLRMEIAGQKILFCGDSELDMVFLAERYGSYLKSDLLQVTHHGFNGGTTEAYRLVDPEVCLVPVSEKLFYGTMGVYREENCALIYDLNVKEIITGSRGDQVLPLPYRAKANGVAMLLDTARQWQENLGSRSWVFGDLTWETCRFSVLNLTAFEGCVRADLLFEDPAYNVRAIVIKAPGKTVKRVDFTDSRTIEADALYFNPSSLAKKGIPAGKTFAVHFTSDRPLVIWGEKEPAHKK